MELGLLLNWKMDGGRESFAAKGLYGYRALQFKWLKPKIQVAPQALQFKRAEALD
ncbi:hypothetical protein [Kroppenstedtia sanguinis]|uniref:Uncharacterized protein n=1 Tax=Kroppenstedtia sanguinis TaxID=1380684 RepID=A0ABW4C972_9BACL